MPQITGDIIEEKLRTELNISEKIPYKIEFQKNISQEKEQSKKTIASHFFSASENLFFTLIFEVPGKRQCKISIQVTGNENNSSIGTIFCTTILNKIIKSEIALQPPRRLFKSKFIGDFDACYELNSNKALLKLCNTFSLTNAAYGEKSTIKSFFKIIPSGSFTTFIANTIPETTENNKYSLKSADFLQIAEMIESTL